MVPNGYILFKNLRTEGLNAEANQYIAGFPAITSFTGYGHLFERKVNEFFPENPITVNGVAVISHAFHLYEGHPKCTGGSEGLQKNKIVSPPILEEVKADMTVTLVFSVTVKEDPEENLPEIVGEYAHKFLDSFPLCGGSVWPQSETQYFLDEQELWVHLETFSDGHFLIERTDLLTGIEDDSGEDSLDELLNALTTSKGENASGKDVWERSQPGWIIPIAVGYQAIEVPQKRLNVRDIQPHVYAEPVINLGEFMPIEKMVFDYSVTKEVPKIFWKHKHNFNFGLYYTTTK